MNLKVENPNNLPTLSITSLIPSQGELKDLSKENYNKLKASFEKHGFIFPVSVWQDKDGKNYLIDGHQRKRVIESEYGDADVPTIKIPAKNINEAAEILLKVTSQYGTITQEGLDSFIAKYELPEAEIYEATHYDAISYLQQDKDEVEEDEAPEVSDEPPVSELGKIYQLGRHRVMCGDSTDRANVEKLLEDNTIDFIVTDPPYGIDWNTDYTRFTGIRHLEKNHSKVENDTAPFDPTFFMTLSKDCLFFGANCFSNSLPLGSWIVWDKRFDNDVAFLADAEVAWYTGSGAVYIIKETSQGYNHSDEGKFHPTQKPIKLMAKVLEKIKAANTIFDPFLGSGSTLIACEQTDRTCYGMELDPKYVDVIRKRYAKFTNDNELPENWEDLTPPVV